MLVEAQRTDVTEPFRVVDQGPAVGDDGVVDGVPVAPEFLGHVADGLAPPTDLVGRPPSRAVGQGQTWRSDPVIDLGPGPPVALSLPAREAPLVPHEGDLAAGH